MRIEVGDEVVDEVGGEVREEVVDELGIEVGDEVVAEEVESGKSSCRARDVEERDSVDGEFDVTERGIEACVNVGGRDIGLCWNLVRGSVSAAAADASIVTPSSEPDFGEE